MKFISSTGGAENFFANVSIGYAQGMYYLSSSGLECKVEKQAYNRCEKLRHFNAKIITNWKRKTDRLAECEKTIILRHVVWSEVAPPVCQFFASNLL